MEEISETKGNETAFGYDGPDYSSGGDGLTKREYFAALAMQGILSNRQMSSTEREMMNEAPRIAVKIADALIVELNKDIKDIPIVGHDL